MFCVERISRLPRRSVDSQRLGEQREQKRKKDNFVEEENNFLALFHSTPTIVRVCMCVCMTTGTHDLVGGDEL